MLISRDDVAEHLGISPQAVSNLAKKPGCPKQEATGGRVLYAWPEFNLWYWTVIKAPKPADWTEARARREVALAELAEYQVAKLRGELMTVDDFRRVRFDADQRIAARLKTLATRAAPLMVGCETEAEVVLRLAPVVREVMDELYRGDDIPADEAA